MKWIKIFTVFVVFVYCNNASWFRAVPSNEISFLAHRGVHQTYSKIGLSDQDCTADKIYKPENEFLENTIESIEQAFSFGAEIVEIDIKITKDKQFAVFHDATIDCRTNGKGQTRKQTLAYLQSLDIGYGYTYDGGKTFPLRGKGVGKMPSLAEVLDKFPQQKFLINIKDGNDSVAGFINEFLNNRSNEDLSRLSFYGRGSPTEELLKLNPNLIGFNKRTVKKCAIEYASIGWSGYVPQSCRNTFMIIPKEYANYLWGWPRLLVHRMNKVNTQVILVDRSDGHMDGLDDPEYIKALSKDYRGMVWTDKIEKVGKVQQVQ